MPHNRIAAYLHGQRLRLTHKSQCDALIWLRRHYLAALQRNEVELRPCWTPPKKQAK